VILDETYNQILVVVIDVSENDYLGRDIMLIQPTNYKVCTLVSLDHQMYVAVGTPTGNDKKNIMVLYSVNQAGQMKTIDQFDFINEKTYQVRSVDKDNLIILEDTN
jgi:hypothetical protein